MQNTSSWDLHVYSLTTEHTAQSWSSLAPEILLLFWVEDGLFSTLITKSKVLFLDAAIRAVNN